MDKCCLCNEEGDVFYIVSKDEVELKACLHCYGDMFDEVDEDWLNAKEVA